MPMAIMAATDEPSSAYIKSFVPLESDPVVMNSLMHDLGVSQELFFVDVWSIDDPDELSLYQRPVHALVLLLPTTEEYEEYRKSTKGKSLNQQDQKEKDIMWLSQTIDNACGLYAILHAVCNFKVKDYIREWFSMCLRRIL